MSSVYDALRISKRLQEAGFTRKQADAIAELLRDEIIGANITKQHLDDAIQKQAVSAEIANERFSHALEQAKTAMTLRFGTLIAGGIAVFEIIRRYLLG